VRALIRAPPVRRAPCAAPPRAPQAPTRPGWRPLLETKPDFVRIMDITTMRASDDPRTMIPAPHPRAWSERPCAPFWRLGQRPASPRPQALAFAPVACALASRPSHASSRSAEVPQIADIRESAWDVYHGKFPQAASRRFRRTSSAPSQVRFRGLAARMRCASDIVTRRVSRQQCVSCVSARCLRRCSCARGSDNTAMRRMRPNLERQAP
jgi:hypothetical protein